VRTVRLKSFYLVLLIKCISKLDGIPAPFHAISPLHNKNKTTRLCEEERVLTGQKKGQRYISSKHLNYSRNLWLPYRSLNSKKIIMTVRPYYIKHRPQKSWQNMRSNYFFKDYCFSKITWKLRGNSGNRET